MEKSLMRIYYIMSSGEVLDTIINNRFDGYIPTKEEDFEIYESLKDKNINDIDFIELECEALIATFNNAKSYKINLESKQLELIYYTNEELESMENQEQESQEFNNRISDISEYLSEQPRESISSFEDYILQSELNKIMEGMI